jgi:PilZ domain
VNWSARVRSIAEAEWHPGQVINLSVSGVLLKIEQAYEIGERVEVEIDFVTPPECTSIVAGVGWIVREDGNDPRNAAIHFDLGCRLKFVDS